VTSGISGMDSRFRGNDSVEYEIDNDQLKDKLKINQEKLKINQEKQSKLTDAYLENLLSEDVYREKITSLRNEEESLKKLLAGYELREMERERSEGYINRVKDFLDGYDDSKEKLDFADKKELARLLFKNIKIAPAIGGARPQKRISFSLFAPFNFLFSETEKKLQCQKNQKLTKICRKKSISAPSDEISLRFYDILFSLFSVS